MLLPIPAAPALWLLQLLDRLPFPVPVSAENLRGLMATRLVDTSADVARLSLRLRGPDESLRALFGDPTGVGCLVRD
jgi:hypothetical protein